MVAADAGLWKFNDGREGREGVAGLSRVAQLMSMGAWEGMAGEVCSEERSGKRRLVRQQDIDMRSVLMHAEISSWRKQFHAATGTTAESVVGFRQR